MMKHLFSLVALVVLGSNMLQAQRVEEGKKFFYYHRYISAKETFQKILDKNPNDIDAVYWMGQTLLEGDDDTASAQSLYQKALANNGNAPLLLVGMGQIELMQGKTDDAHQRFETAISLTKGKDVDIYNAVARANVFTKAGDANYAIQKLNDATQVRRFNDPTTYVLMGDAYRKLVDGGNAVQAYNKAFTMDPTLAEAKFEIGKIYLTQQNNSLFLKYMEDAINADANYAPAYYALYTYWYNIDVNLARENLQKYANVADVTPSLDYDRTSVIYAAHQYQEAIDTAKSFISKLGANADPRYYKLIGYCYATLKDSANAKTFMDQYMAKQKPNGFLPNDYSFYAQLEASSSDSLARVDAFNNYDKAVSLDTSLNDKLKTMDQAARLAKKMGNHQQEAVWYKKIYKTDTSASNRDLYNWGYAELVAGNYDSAYSVFSTYQQKFPDEIYGYLWGSRAAQGIDTAFTTGLAADAYEKLAGAATRIDSVRFKPYIIQSYSVLAQYYNNVKQNKDSAIVYLKKILQVDPSNPDAQKYINILEKSEKQEATQQRRTGGTSNKPKSSASGSRKR